MREILFRGKKKETGEWIEGSLVLDKFKDLEACIRDFGREYHFVNPETVGQYIGLTDNNGKKIFEGDIIKISETGYVPESILGKVIYHENAFKIWTTSKYYEKGLFYDFKEKKKFNEGKAIIDLKRRFFVIGNIYDHANIKLGSSLEKEE